MTRDSRGGDIQRRGDVAIALPDDDEPEDVVFATCERRLQGLALCRGLRERVRVRRVEELFESKRGRFPIWGAEGVRRAPVQEAQAAAGQRSSDLTKGVRAQYPIAAVVQDNGNSLHPR